MKRVFLAGLLAGTMCAAHAGDKLRALIVDGQNNHTAWPKTTVMLKDYLEKTGAYEVDVARTQYTWNGTQFKDFLPLAGAGESQDLPQPKADPDFKPDFAKYDVVISNLGFKAADWPEPTQRALEEYMQRGGGLVVIHAADNSFPDWKEFNRMIGLGGWGGRTPQHGPYVYYKGDQIVRDTSPGKCGAHAKRNEFVITMRNLEHPITQGLPPQWRTSTDECYSYLRGPAENMIILATGCDSPELQRLERHEPVLMVIDYGKGRVFHTALGHDDTSWEGVGFILTTLRGIEWAATGKVTIPVPDDFPGVEKTTYRKYERQL
ncbi:MAG: ThuA domain-containing protein [Kiritimatiellae bacterium]|nr:ThuA domain-containing protein [Kiritimatiellia bacterium]